MITYTFLLSYFLVSNIVERSVIFKGVFNVTKAAKVSIKVIKFNCNTTKIGSILPFLGYMWVYIKKSSSLLQ